MGFGVAKMIIRKGYYVFASSVEQDFTEHMYQLLATQLALLTVLCNILSKDSRKLD